MDDRHAELAACEGWIPPSERQWMAWVATAETLLGHPLDAGSDAGDGYSLESAGIAFHSGETPMEYALDVQARKAELAA